MKKGRLAIGLETECNKFERTRKRIPSALASNRATRKERGEIMIAIDHHIQPMQTIGMSLAEVLKRQKLLTDRYNG